MNVRPSDEKDLANVAAFLAQNHTTRAARRGQLLNAPDYPALIAEEDDRLLGVLTYIVRGKECEVFTLHTAQQWRGAGTALIAEVERVAREQGCRRLWLITTNDNVDALRFYQRRGFRLTALFPGAVDYSREHLKREISEVGEYGIPLRDEIELEKDL